MERTKLRRLEHEVPLSVSCKSRNCANSDTASSVDPASIADCRRTLEEITKYRMHENKKNDEHTRIRVIPNFLDPLYTFPIAELPFQISNLLLFFKQLNSNLKKKN